ncbi:hypothetical protein BDQ12DRAFT_685401 [Crucibulum laeve]|uniref:Uncharacterized protein n=1 Tax=Crucibulum laeve TaxID=68775 RepID=A0A5C3LWH3_9AGAR|nr:hypothetical protein BDQ12DRAFT_685401 [Crucibulum laeve]
MDPASSHGDSLMVLDDISTLGAGMARTGPTSLPIGYRTGRGIIEETDPSRSNANGMLPVSTGNGTGKKRCRKEGIDKAAVVPTPKHKRVKMSVSAADPHVGSQDHMISASMPWKLRSMKSEVDLSTPRRKLSQNSAVSLHKAKASANTATEEFIVEQSKLNPKSPTKTRTTVGRSKSMIL